MTNKLSLLVLLFCALSAISQNPNPSSLGDIMDWLESNSNSTKDSTELGIYSRKAILLSKKSSNQNALAQSYRYLAKYPARQPLALPVAGSSSIP